MPDSTTAPSTPAAQAAANRLAGIRPPAAAVGPATPAADRKLAKTSEKKDEKSAPGTKRKIPVKVVALVLLVLVVGYVAKGKIIKPHYGPHDPVPAGAIFDFPSSVTTNLPDGSLAQISISLQLTKVGSSKVVTKDTSELVGTAVQIIGGNSYATLLSTPGRAALQAALLHAFQSELGTTEGAQQVSAVYFTSYVLQQQ
ncbi:MAG: Flagellar protein FliL [Acidimicrobiaceae bacterium]|jgi:flagellar basal body-associated protein FliL|nr:Flagellar protein FliL [Acidimicrobiaceae bacterium]